MTKCVSRNNGAQLRTILNRAKASPSDICHRWSGDENGDCEIIARLGENVSIANILKQVFCSGPTSVSQMT